MAELLYSLERVFTTYPNGKIYNIPEYQRGYKWSEQQVRQLLDDIYKFSLTRNEHHFYCLQNITLFQNSDKNLNVVDGQQRLTTVTLLLAYLEVSNLVKGKLNYAVREPSNRFIQNVIDNESNFINGVLAAEDFETYLADQTDDIDYQDVYYMFTALRTIDSWFKNNFPTKDIEAFKVIVLNHVKLIVNKVAHVSEQELFMNLNAGKVHLDGSDLIRAILITRVAKQELEDYDPANVQDILKLNQRRTRIGWELDEMNNWWSKEEVKSYFQNFTKIQAGKKETIKFDQELHPINLLYKIWVETNGEMEITLHCFEKEEALAMYQSILKLHRILQDWFEDRKIYHYLGFLFAHSKSFKINKVYKKWNAPNTARDKFVNEWCLKQLQTAVFGREEEDKEDEGYSFWMEKIKDYNSKKPTNWYHSVIIQKVLILLDVIAHSEIKEKGIPLPFLKPRYFKNSKEDKEHIFSGTPKELSELKKLSQPIVKLNEYIDLLNKGYEDINRISHFKYDDEEWSQLTEELQSQELEQFKQLIHTQRPINSLGNLVLLHLSINRGFGNDRYAKKRTEVIQNTVNGLYVRQHTVDVFVKNTETENLNDWNLQDIEKNADNIYTSINEFFKPIL